MSANNGLSTVCRGVKCFLKRPNITYSLLAIGWAVVMAKQIEATLPFRSSLSMGLLSRMSAMPYRVYTRSSNVRSVLLPYIVNPSRYFSWMTIWSVILGRLVSGMGQVRFYPEWERRCKNYKFKLGMINKKFWDGFWVGPPSKFWSRPQNFFAQKIRAIHEIDVKFNADYEYQFYFQIGDLFLLKWLKILIRNFLKLCAFSSCFSAVCKALLCIAYFNTHPHVR